MTNCRNIIYWKTFEQELEKLAIFCGVMAVARRVTSNQLVTILQGRGIMLESIKKVYCFYRDGFSRMTLGKTLWKIIIIKLVIMFAVLKLFFFPNFLKTHFENDQLRADYVLEQLTSKGSDTLSVKEDL